ncbi:Uncharacterized protein HZ326_2800 [Fusarium oxysporum f. sp. albedinis]|nr:Uncharacterized protein HZ326_2800 [Fusarium oxysporum f. sp. albedinis]
MLTIPRPPPPRQCSAKLWGAVRPPGGHQCERRKRRGCCGESWRHLNFTPPPLHRGSHIRHIAPRWAPPLVPYFHSSTKKPRVILKNKYSLPVVNISIPSLSSTASHISYTMAPLTVELSTPVTGTYQQPIGL